MKKSLIVSALILSLFSGCSRPLKPYYPRLHTWEVEDINITYEVYDENG